MFGKILPLIRTHHKANILEYWQGIGALNHAAPENWFWEKDRHHTAIGYQALANALVESFSEGWFVRDSLEGIPDSVDVE